MTVTVVALYDDLRTARHVAEHLIDQGFNRQDISLAAGDTNGEYRRYIGAEQPVAGADNAVATGAGIGAVVGGISGLLVGLGALLIPGVGPIIAAGPLFTTLTSMGVGAGLGAVTGGLAGALADMGVPEEEAQYYAEGVRRGGTLVTIQVAADRIEPARRIMEHHDPIDIEERVSQWRQQGWGQFDGVITPSTTPSRQANSGAGAFDAAHEVGEFDDYALHDAQFRQHYQDNYANNSSYSFDNYASAYRYGLDLATYHYYGNRRGWAEVEPEIRRSWEERNPGTWANFKGAVQYAWEEVTDALGFDNDYENYQSMFQRHYNENYARSGQPYNYYDMAYRYGYGLSHDPRFNNRSWAELEPEARRYWEEQHEGSWDQFKDAVRHSWEEVKRVVDVH
jgi:hypothetical protein